MGRKIEGREDALACLSAWNRSGLALAVWCRERGVDGRSLNCWRKNLRWEPPMALVELVAGEAPDARYVVRVDGVEIEVGDDFQEATLARLLRVLLAC